MAVIDRAVLRLAVYELAHRPDVPTGAIVDEAVELAKQLLHRGVRPVRQRGPRARSRPTAILTAVPVRDASPGSAITHQNGGGAR